MRNAKPKGKQAFARILHLGSGFHHTDFGETGQANKALYCCFVDFK